MKVGVLGKGQLGRMMAFAAKNANLCEVIFYEPSEQRYTPNYETPSEKGITGEKALSLFIEESDVVTFETENTDNALAYSLSAQKPFSPSVTILEIASHRLKEKNLFRSLGIPVPEFFEVIDTKSLKDAAKSLGFPFVLKTSTMGYDGKGQTVFKTENDLDKFSFDNDRIEYIAEAWVKYEFETSIIAAAGQDGTIVFYPMGKNIHREGILFQSRIEPNLISDALQKQAKDYAKKIIQEVNYIGVFALELFVTADGLLANECAPRVHNSGHWTIEGCDCSQFENHLRAVSGLNVVEPKLLHPYVVMQNIIGSFPEKLPEIDNINVHDYDKSPRPGRKIGHLTLVSSSSADYNRKLGLLDK
ncbi:MAG: 5-(carboxyamino)imidazole ribonucleotide synthase [Legionellales bacterium]|nr:5-(carboxyamino)imidazole ribonucleotide synthase [Legionellales bacterium]